MSHLAELLQASLLPATRRHAEQSLQSLSSQEGFLPHLLQLILNQDADPSVRLAGGVCLKNLAKLRWGEGSLSFLVSATRCFSFCCGAHRRCSRFPSMTKLCSVPSSFPPCWLFPIPPR